jgi:hypothetical protein
MTYNPNNIYQQSVPAPNPPEPNRGLPATRLPVVWGYGTIADNKAAVAANGYFTPFANFNMQNVTPDLRVGDIINASCTDGVQILAVTAIAAGVNTAVLAP